jgi:arabinofuranosyltransferase
MSPAAARPLVYALVVTAICGTALWIGAHAYLPFIADDSLISLRYSERLIHGEGLTWTDGERVEGYSNLLWVLICALVGAFRVDLIEASRACGLLAMFAVVPALLVAAGPLNLQRALAALGASLLFVFAGPIRVWAIGGLEQPLIAGTLVWGFALALPAFDDDAPITRKRLLLAGLLLALTSLTRPDGALFAGTLAAALVLHRRWRLAFPVALPTAAAVTLQLLFRRLYYDTWVPNTAHAKLAFTSQRLTSGEAYLWEGTRALAPLAWATLFAFVVGLIAGGAPRRRALALALPLIAWVGYVAVIGGDIFPARRHLVPAIALCALLISAVLSHLPWRTLARCAVVAVPIAAAVFLAFAEGRDDQNTRAHQERWEWDGAVIGQVLREGFSASKPLLATDPAGCLPYFSKLPALDLMGLNDRYIATHPPASLGTGYIGHELGDGKYVLSREPDLIVFCGPGGNDRPCFLSGAQMFQDPSFFARYRLVSFEGYQPYRFRARIWTRWEGGKIGVQSTANRVDVPGFLFANQGEIVAQLGAGSALVAGLPPNSETRVEGIRLPPGNWAIETRSRGPVAVLAASDLTERSVLTLERETTVSLIARTQGEAGQLEAVSLVRSNPE